MTPYMRYHPDLSGSVFVTLVGFWELNVEQVPQEYYNVRHFYFPPLHPYINTL